PVWSHARQSRTNPLADLSGASPPGTDRRCQPSRFRLIKRLPTSYTLPNAQLVWSRCGPGSVYQPGNHYIGLLAFVRHSIILIGARRFGLPLGVTGSGARRLGRDARRSAATRTLRKLQVGGDSNPRPPA